MAEGDSSPNTTRRLDTLLSDSGEIAFSRNMPINYPLSPRQAAAAAAKRGITQDELTVGIQEGRIILEADEYGGEESMALD